MSFVTEFQYVNLTFVKNAYQRIRFKAHDLLLVSSELRQPQSAIRCRILLSDFLQRGTSVLSSPENRRDCTMGHCAYTHGSGTAEGSLLK
jgi:hypothetical protein